MQNVAPQCLRQWMVEVKEEMVTTMGHSLISCLWNGSVAGVPLEDDEEGEEEEIHQLIGPRIASRFTVLVVLLLLTDAFCIYCCCCIPSSSVVKRKL